MLFSSRTEKIYTHHVEKNRSDESPTYLTCVFDRSSRVSQSHNLHPYLPVNSQQLCPPLCLMSRKCWLVESDGSACVRGSWSSPELVIGVLPMNEHATKGFADLKIHCCSKMLLLHNRARRDTGTHTVSPSCPLMFSLVAEAMLKLFRSCATS